MSNRKAFTLIELLVVIAIIGILATVVLVGLNIAKKRATYASFKSTVSSVNSMASICMDSNKSLNSPAVAGSTEVCNLTAGADSLWPKLPSGCPNAGYSAISSVPLNSTFSFTATCETGECSMTCTQNGCTPTGC